MELLSGGEIFEAVRRLISSAERSIYLVSAWLGGEAVGELLRELPSNIHLEVVLRASSPEDLKITSERSFRLLAKVNARTFLSERLHSKFLIVDEREAIVGSANFTSPGLSISPNGNVETVLHLRREENPELFERLLSHYREIKESSFLLEERLLGFVVNPSEVHRFTFISFEGRVPPTHSFVRVKVQKGTLLGEVISVHAYRRDYPQSPHKGNTAIPLSDWSIKELLTQDGTWNLALLRSATSSKPVLYEVSVKPILVISPEGKTYGISEPPVPGTAVYRAEGPEVKNTFLLNGLLKPSKIPIKVGKSPGGSEIFLDFEELRKGHLAVLGTTGSGKSHFVKLLLRRISKNNPFDGGIHIIDPHGEYAEVLKECFGKDLKEVKLPDTLLPPDGESFEEILKEAGFGYPISGSSHEARRNRDLLHSAVRPTLKKHPLKDKSLQDLLAELKPSNLSKEVVETLTQIYGEEALQNQPEVLGAVEENLLRTGLTVWNLSEVSDSLSASTLVGLIVGELFSLSRNDLKSRFLVVEETHLFAPEKGYGELPAGKENLSLRNLVKVASQGRKFNLTLAVIGQRSAQINKFLLSQMNNQVLFRLLGKGDLEACKAYLPSVEEGVVDYLPSLKVGECFMNGPIVFTTIKVKVGDLKDGCGGGI